MASAEIVKEYNNGDFVVVWKPRKCIHAGICVKTLPEVYKPEEKPWINAENATVEALKAQIDQCPSGALTYYSKNEAETSADSGSDGTKVDVMQNGPLLVHGLLLVTGNDGQQETKEKTTAFCRCGASENKPYCDGAHKKINFEG